MARTLKREEVAFPSAPDPRFGGNLARANVGKQYSRAFPGGPPGVDRMYENYQAPHRVDYTSPPYGGPGEPSLGEWRQQIDPRGKRQRGRHLQHLYGDPPYGQSDTFTNPFYPPKQHPNPRGMGGGLGGLQEQAAVDPSDWRTIIKILEAGGDPGTETQVAEMGGYGYNPAPKSYDDIYEGLDIIDMEVLPGEGYGPSDEYDYDRKRGYPGYIYDSPPSYAARGGLMSLRR